MSRPVGRRTTRPSAGRFRGRALLAAWVTLCGLALGYASPVVAATADPDAGTTPAYQESRTLTREMTRADGTVETIDTRQVTVKVSATTDLQDRERVRVSWTGAHPTGGRTSDPYGANGLGQEYPVVILLCRGVENPTEGQEELAPETCWTTSRNERSGAQSSTFAVWAHDMYADPKRIALGGSASPWPEACDPDDPAYRNFLVPFRAANGKVYWQCAATGTTAPEQATDAALPANDVFASTSPDGTGSMLFEVRTSEVNESLGCSDKVACSIVVIPVMGISCKDQNPQCRRTGIWAPGTLRSDSGDGFDYAVVGDFWWSPSNWRGRFTVPVAFAPPPKLCDLLDSRSPVSFYGSELLNQATLQWTPAYCLAKDRFKFTHNRASESLGRRQLGSAEAVAAFVSDPVTNGSLSVAYAPTAVTGWGIGYVADKADNGGEVTSLRLTPRLVAKLLTESYAATPSLQKTHCDISGDSDVEVLKQEDVAARDAVKLPLGEGRCEVRTTSTRTEKVDGKDTKVTYLSIAEGTLDLLGNPIGITDDPEFTALNPGVPSRTQVSEAFLLALSQDGDAVRAMTSWIAADPKAKAFIAGTPDEHGMRVNGYYKDVSLPVSDWPLLDQFPSQSTMACISSLAGSTPAMQLLAAPVTSLRKTSEALLDAWPYSQLSASGGAGGAPCKWDRPRLSFGTRFMLALVPVADADRLGLRVASLSTSSEPTATFQAPTALAMSSALSVFAQEEPGGIFTADYGAMPSTAYPGTMIVSTAALTKGLPAADAAHVAQFIKIATTEGQTPGRGNGQLPDGYLPITEAGVTAPLYAAAQLSATAIEKQDPSVLDPPAPAPAAAPPAVPPAPPAVVAPVSAPVPTGDLPSTGTSTDVPGLPAAETPTASAPAPGVATVVDTSTAAGAAVPGVLGVALAGVVGAPFLRLVSTRRRRA